MLLRFKALLVAMAVCVGSMIACSGSNSSELPGSGSTLPSSGTDSGAGGASTGSGDGGFTLSGGGTGDGGMEICEATEAEAEKQHLDIYFVIDRSGSMGGSGGGLPLSAWDGSVAALKQYFTASQGGESASLTFFPKDNDGMGNGTISDACNPNHYEPPHIPLSDLPMAASDLNAALDLQNPEGSNTPTYGALHGVYQHAVAQQDADPDHVVIIVLATDGQPNSCPTTPQNQNDVGVIADLAGSAYNYNGVMTFCVAIQGATIAALDQIAAKGGSGNAFDVTSDIMLFQQKMQEIRAQALGCEYPIPDPGENMAFDPTKLNIEYTPAGMGSTIDIPQADDASDCGSAHGWYFVPDSVNPTGIRFCAATCNMVQADGEAKIDFLFGCPTIVN